LLFLWWLNFKHPFEIYWNCRFLYFIIVHFIILFVYMLLSSWPFEKCDQKWSWISFSGQCLGSSSLKPDFGGILLCPLHWEVHSQKQAKWQEVNPTVWNGRHHILQKEWTWPTLTVNMSDTSWANYDSW
jgi:hypothetical protein